MLKFLKNDNVVINTDMIVSIVDSRTTPAIVCKNEIYFNNLTECEREFIFNIKEKVIIFLNNNTFVQSSYSVSEILQIIKNKRSNLNE